VAGTRKIDTNREIRKKKKEKRKKKKEK